MGTIGDISEAMESIESVDIDQAEKISMGVLKRYGIEDSSDEDKVFDDHRANDLGSDRNDDQDKIKEGEFLIQVNVKVDSKVKTLVPYHTWMTFSAFNNRGKVCEHHRGIGMMQKDGFGVGAMKNRKATIASKAEDGNRPFSGIARIEFISRKNLINERNLDEIGESTIELMRKFGDYNITENNCRSFVDIFLSFLFGCTKRYTKILLGLKISKNHVNWKKLKQEYYILPKFYFGVQKTLLQNRMMYPEDVSESEMVFYESWDHDYHSRGRMKKRIIVRNVEYCRNFDLY